MSSRGKADPKLCSWLLYQTVVTLDTITPGSCSSLLPTLQQYWGTSEAQWPTWHCCRASGKIGLCLPPTPMQASWSRPETLPVSGTTPGSVWTPSNPKLRSPAGLGEGSSYHGSGVHDQRFNSQVLLIAHFSEKNKLASVWKSLDTENERQQQGRSLPCK